MVITVPSGERHIGAVWREDNLWVENYDPATNTCYIREYAKDHLLQGKVSINNCNPLLPLEKSSDSSSTLEPGKQ